MSGTVRQMCPRFVSCRSRWREYYGKAHFVEALRVAEHSFADWFRLKIIVLPVNILYWL